MSARRPVLIAVLIAILGAWPIALFVAGNYFRHAVVPLAFAAFASVVICAVILRSRVIAGALLGLVVGAFFALPSVNSPSPEVRDLIPLVLATIFGALLGQAWQEGHDARKQ